MDRIKAIALLLLLAFPLSGQTPVGTWSDHLSYHTASSIAVGTTEVYVSTGASLMIYNKEYTELKKVSKINGLTETGISAISWSDEYRILIIGYKSANVDLLQKNAVFNIPDILNKYIPGTKKINRIRSDGKYAYLACSFGIVVIDLVRKQVYDTWHPSLSEENNEVNDLSIAGGRVYAATASGVYSAGLDDQGLSYFGNWNRISSLPDPAGNYTAIASSGDNLFTSKNDPLAQGDSVFLAGSSMRLLSYLPGIYNHSMDPGTDGFTISSGSIARYYGGDGVLKRTISNYGFAIPDISAAVADKGDIWIADIKSGLVSGRSMTDFTKLTLPGPVSNNAWNLTSHDGQTILCGGGTDNSWNSLGRAFGASVFMENNWTSLPAVGVNDAMRAIADPSDGTHIFVSTWGGGLLEYRGGNLIHHYDDSNSPLQTIVPGKTYVRICGLAMDKDKNLWMTQSGVSGSIKVLKPDGTWIVNPVTTDAPVTGDLIITKAGHKWMILPSGYGLFVLDDNKTPEVFGDDRYKRLTVKDAENQIIYSVYSIAEDLDGNVWIGTDQGPLVYYNPERVFTEDLRANRIKVPRNDGSGLADYLLKTETVSTISVDGSNRKWLGTRSSGAYYVSPDGVTQLKNFSTHNSPILSDSILSISVDNKTGDIWFATSAGLQSYRGNATEGGETFSKVYAFPNPVREDFYGSVTVTGLIKDTKISITDISGNLVYETVSDGGQATWDMKTYNGKQVTTGVYLIFCASSDGSQAFVTKILIIRK
jgi:hypothetical protein